MSRDFEAGACSDMPGAGRRQRPVTHGRTHGSGPEDIAEGRVVTSSGLSGAGACECPRNPRTKRDSVGLPDLRRCKTVLRG